jgi:exodeoxyribonuclease III
MRITTWNVNGLRALLRNDRLRPLLTQRPDILMMQEIKARPEQIPAEHSQSWATYQEVWHPAERAGYSGVAALCRAEPAAVQVGLGDTRFDTEGRCILLRYPDFTLVNAYFPSGQRGQERVAFKLEFYAALLEICDRLHTAGEKLVVGGDFNTAHNEIDLRYPKQNRKTSGFLPEERAWVDRYLAHGFVDAYRLLYPERVQYTWWTYRMNARQNSVGWRLDYFLVSESLLPRVQDVIVHDEILGSDHCPVTLVLAPDEDLKP